MNLATRGNHKILRSVTPHISSTEEIHHRLTRRTLAQPRANESPILKSYSHIADTKSHPSPLCSLCNTTPHFTCIHIHTKLSTRDLWTITTE